MKATDLSENQLEILSYLLAGHTVKKIAGLIDRSPRAIHDRIRGLRQKVGARSLVQLGVWAERNGIREGQA